MSPQIIPTTLLAHLLLLTVFQPSPTHVVASTPTVTPSPSPSPSSSSLTTTSPTPSPSAPPLPACGTRSDQCSYTDAFHTINATRWYKASGWYSGTPFGSYVHDKLVSIRRAKYLRLNIRRRKKPQYGLYYRMGQLQTRVWHGYGCFEVRHKAVKVPGTVSSFFLYTGVHNNADGYPTLHNEIDVEFVWKNSSDRVGVQANYYTNGTGGHEYTHFPSTFLPEDGFHNYAFKWTAMGIEWYVNGELIHSASGDTPTMGTGPMKLFMNFWTIRDDNEGAKIWAGRYTHVRNRKVFYDSVKFTRGEDCVVSNDLPIQ